MTVEERIELLKSNILHHTQAVLDFDVVEIRLLDRASGRLYGYRSDPHSHLTCLDSGAIEDLDVELPAELLERIEQQTGYRIESYTLSLSGRRR